MEIHRGVRCFRRIDDVLVLDSGDMEKLTEEGFDRVVNIFDSSLRREHGVSSRLPGGGVVLRAYSNNQARYIAVHLVEKGLTQEHIKPLR